LNSESGRRTMAQALNVCAGLVINERKRGVIRLA
jgi:hypothetical protein